MQRLAIAAPHFWFSVQHAALSAATLEGEHGDPLHRLLALFAESKLNPDGQKPEAEVDPELEHVSFSLQQTSRSVANTHVLVPRPVRQL